ncbi:MAG: ABC transporter ATP-binding protein [Lachnospira sp.]
MKSNENSGKKPNIFFWFMGLMGKRLPVYLTAILVSIVGFAGSKIANAWLIKNIMEAAQTKETDGLIVTIVVNFLVIVASMFTWRFGIVRYNIEAKRGIARVEKQVFAKALRLPMAYYENNHSGDFMSKLVYDMEKAGDIYGSRLRRLLDGILTTIIYLIPMLILNWRLTLCLLVVSGMSLLANSIFVKPMKKMGGKLSVKNAVMTEKITNILAGMETTKIFPTGHQLLYDYDVANDDCYKIQKKTNTMTASLDALNNLFDLLSALAFLGVGVWFVSKNMTTLGSLTAIYSIYGSFRFVVLEIGKYIPQMMNCIANAERIHDFLEQEEEPESYEMSGETDISVEVSARGVTFGYNDGKRVLENYSLDVNKGEFVALTGKSGCGKSTFAKLLLGFYEPEQGNFAVEGISYSEMSLREVRDKIGYVPQEPYLFECSIAENIAYGRTDVAPEDVPMEDIISAAKAANAHDFIMKLPDGYNTIPGERGNTLSGGEKQRIAIARAVLKNAPVLLLDEATSALDNDSERLVNEAIERLCKDRTTIMIAHRSSTIARATRVITIT